MSWRGDGFARTLKHSVYLRVCMRSMTGRYESDVMRYDVTRLSDR